MKKLYLRALVFAKQIQELATAMGAPEPMKKKLYGKAKALN